MTVDLSEFEAEIATSGPKCGVARVLEDLPDEKHERLLEALVAPHITARAVSRVVTGWGFKLSDQTVTRHRAGRCSCP